MTFVRAILDSVQNTIVFAVDREFRYVYFNKAHEYAMRVGYGTELAIGKPLVDCITNERDRVAGVANFARAIRGESFSNLEVFGTEELSHFESTFNPIVDASGAIIGASCIARDVSDRVRAQEALANANRELADAERRLAEAERDRLRQSTLEADERYRRIIETTEEGIWTIDANAVTDFVNRRMAEMLGYTPEEMVGRPLEAFMAPDEYAEAQVNVKRREQGIAEQHRFRLLHKSGAEVWTSMTTNPITNAEGAYVGALAMVTDITARLRAEAEQARLEGQLEQARKLESVGRLAGGVAHDFNNMLGVIIGHACMALDEIDVHHPLHADLVAIRDAAERSADITRQLLTVARKQAIKPRVLDLNEKVTGVLPLIRRMVGENLNLEWVAEDDPWLVQMDPSQLDQIVTNLCVNARDAIDDVGTIRIASANAHVEAAQAANHPDAVPGDYVRLSVADSGSGIATDVLPNIFEPFFTTKGVGKGTGLGLASVYGSVRQSGGFIEVTSHLGQGTTFDIYLPRATEPGVTPAEPTPVPVMGGVETIMVVEDEHAVLSLATRALVAQGYRVLSADAPGDAIRLADGYKGHIDLLVTDVIMPHMNGRDLSAHLSAKRSAMKTLYMSGYTADLIPLQGVLADGLHFLEKPFAINELILFVRRILDSRGV